MSWDDATSGDDLQEQLVRLFWGVIAPFNSRVVPAGTKPMAISEAVARAMAVVHRNDVGVMRAAFRRIEAGLPNQWDHANGQIDVSEYNRRIISIIQGLTMELDRVGAEVQSNLDEMEGRNRRY